MQRWILAVVVVLVVVVGLWWWADEEPATEPGTDATPTVAPKPQPADEAAPGEPSVWSPPTLHYDTYTSRYGPLPASLEGTQIPFFITLDDEQHLVPTHTLRRFFEYFFTTVGEEPLDTIIARLEELIRNHVPEPAASEVLTALRQYLALKEAELALEEQIARDFAASGRVLDVRERARLLRDLRATHLPRDLYQAFYGEEDRRDDYALTRLDIMQNDQLTEAEKVAAMAALEGDLPPALQEHVREQRLAWEVNQQVDAARARGATDAEIFQIRAETYGYEAAQRFSEADQRKAAWETRIQDYRRERAAILATDSLTETDKAQQIERLQEQHFDAQEQKRIPTIDRIWDQRETGQAP